MTIAAWLFGAGGVLLIGIGAFFILVRPALLPEDLRFLGRSGGEIDEFVPRLRMCVNLDLVKQLGGQILRRCAGATAHHYVLPGRRLLGHLRSCLDSLGHESEWRVAVENEGLSRVMSRRLASPI